MTAWKTDVNPGVRDYSVSDVFAPCSPFKAS